MCRPRMLLKDASTAEDLTIVSPSVRPLHKTSMTNSSRKDLIRGSDCTVEDSCLEEIEARLCESESSRTP